MAVTGTAVFTYYVGNIVNGTGSSIAPTNAGTYTVVAAFTSSNANYGIATSAPVTVSSGSSISRSRGPSTLR